MVEKQFILAQACLTKAWQLLIFDLNLLLLKHNTLTDKFLTIKILCKKLKFFGVNFLPYQGYCG